MLVDFHSHTDHSDGTLSTEALLGAFRARGVTFASITDHDALSAYETNAAQTSDASRSPRIVSGVEINTTYQGNEVHILGYGFPLGSELPLRAVLERNREARRERVERMVAQLKRAGYDVALDDVLGETSAGATLGRPHVAKALVRRGLVRDVESAFRTLLGPDRPGYVPSNHIRPHDAVAAIARSEGVAVLAHPGRLRDGRLIDELVEAGIAGLEVFYPTHSSGQVAHFRGLAEHYGIVMTGGSDFHDIRWNVTGVGIEVDADDIQPFLDLVL